MPAISIGLRIDALLDLIRDMKIPLTLRHIEALRVDILRFTGFSRRFQTQPQEVITDRIVRLDPKRFSKVRDGFSLTIGIHKQLGQAVPDHRILGVHGQDLFKLLNPFLTHGPFPLFRQSLRFSSVAGFASRAECGPCVTGRCCCRSSALDGRSPGRAVRTRRTEFGSLAGRWTVDSIRKGMSIIRRRTAGIPGPAGQEPGKVARARSDINDGDGRIRIGEIGFHLGGQRAHQRRGAPEEPVDPNDVPQVPRECSSGRVSASNSSGASLLGKAWKVMGLRFPGIEGLNPIEGEPGGARMMSRDCRMGGLGFP